MPPDSGPDEQGGMSILRCRDGVSGMPQIPIFFGLVSYPKEQAHDADMPHAIDTC